MATNASIAQIPVIEQAPVNFILKDGVYPYDDPEDKFVIIIDGEEVAWSGTYAQAWRSYHEMLRIETAHFTRCPEDRAILINLPGGQVEIMEVL